MVMGKDDHQLKYVTAGLDEDALRCALTVEPGFEPSAASLEICLSRLTELGIGITPLIREQVQGCLRAYEASPQAPAKVELMGQLPLDGQDGWFEWDAKYDPKYNEGHHEDEGAVDYYNQTHYICVHEGDVIGRIHQPTAGDDGVNLLGLVVAAKPGRPAALVLDETLKLTEDGQVVAKVSGSIEAEGHCLRVSQELHVAGDVDFSTGNIDFEGNVIVRGGIKDKFHVKCRDDLSVTGVIEAAHIEVGRDLCVSTGVNGHERAVVSVGRHVRARYISQAKLCVHRNVMIQRELLNCEAHIAGDLMIPTGDVVGGVIHVLGVAHLGVLGSEGGIATELHLASSPRHEHQIRRAMAELQAVASKLEPIETEMAEMRAKASMDTQMRERLTVLGMDQMELSSRRQRLEALLQQLRHIYSQLRKVELRVKRVIYPGVRLVIGDMIADIDCGLKGPITITYDDQEGPIVRDHSGSEMLLRSIARVQLPEAA